MLGKGCSRFIKALLVIDEDDDEEEEKEEKKVEKFCYSLSAQVMLTVFTVNHQEIGKEKKNNIGHSVGSYAAQI
jgi:hypothetical protein